MVIATGSSSKHTGLLNQAHPSHPRPLNLELPGTWLLLSSHVLNEGMVPKPM
jgi:hypothetical protein